jgi:septal ring factor EnvC (AmiA/AmiB activator)
VSDARRARLPWLLVAAGLVLTVLLAYTLFGGYLPAKRRVASLERELRQLYQREAELQTKIAQQDQRYSVRERQISALTSERDTLIRRLEELERALGRTPSTPRR